MPFSTRSLALVCTAFAAATIPSSLAAQSLLDARSSFVPRYHLMQLSVDADRVAPDTFAAKTSAISSCGEAKELGKSLDAEITRNRLVRASALPAELQDTLSEMALGHATPVFSADGSVLRVIVLCARK